MVSLLVLTAGSVNQNSSNASGLMFLGIVAIIIVAVILFFKKGKPKGNQIEDEKFYLREIRNYVRIIAIIVTAWAIITIASWIIALL